MDEINEKNNVSAQSILTFPLWEKAEAKRTPLSFDLELTQRCNNNCRHCYINLPENDPAAKKREMSFDLIKNIVDQACSLGALWCLLTGGEPLLREDFFEIYGYLKKKGLLVSVFTNATLITDDHIKLFTNYPPRAIEITVYGISETTYEAVSRKPGSFDRFQRGLKRLKDAGIKTGLKAVAIRSNFHELETIFNFCREQTDTHFRFDPFIHLRYDGDIQKNNEILSERLTDEEIISLERNDIKRYHSMQKSCEKFADASPLEGETSPLFFCASGINNFVVDSYGRLKICSSLCHPDCTFDLNHYSLFEIWYKRVPKVLQIQSNRQAFLRNCASCQKMNLCMWCPATAYLEAGKLDIPVEHFCRLAEKRATLIKPDGL